MSQPLTYHVNKIINQLKQQGLSSKTKGWAMSEIVDYVTYMLGKDAGQLARKIIIEDANLSSNK